MHDLLLESVSAGSDRAALVYKRQTKSYSQLERDVRAVASGLCGLGLAKHDRVAVFLDKQFETAASILGISAAGLVFVPVNPSLRAAQVVYIMGDCNVRVLITSRARLASLEGALSGCPDLKFVFLVDDQCRTERAGVAIAPFEDLLRADPGNELHPTQDTDMVGILYTSGSTGNPKGVVFSHRNFVVGAQSVSQYLKYRLADRIINIPPYSFDFGLNQLFSALYAGATAVLHNYVTPEELMKTIVADEVTGVSGVPTVMIPLSQQVWPAEAVKTVRYLSTTGGRMPEAAVKGLRRALPNADLYLMYGLTEAFRSTYLPPEEVDRRPNSIGKAIPNAEILVVRPDGTICDPEEEGELVHKGVLVTLGYWNDPVRTAERFKPAPGEPPGKANPEIAVWSGDTVKRDRDGFIYYVGRRDEMIKTSGYRISPTEVEEAVFASGEASAAAAVGADDEVLGQTIIVFASPRPGCELDAGAILAHCRKVLPAYMIPQRILRRDEMPLNPNGKIDRKALKAEYAEQLLHSPPADAGLAPVKESFLVRWRNEFLQILGLRSKGFRSVAEVFRWAFPDRPVTASDSFASLGGDSLSYVNVTVGLTDYLGRLPEGWADKPISELEHLNREQSARALVAPDILARVLAMTAVVVSHGHWKQDKMFWGSAALMFLISGMSFARFSWNEDPRLTLRAAIRFIKAIIVPILVLFAVVFTAEGKVDWPTALFFDNYVSPRTPDWFVGAWYIQNLVQCIAFALLLAYIPPVRRFSFRHGYEFAVILLICALAFLSIVPVGFYYWLFPLGWLFAIAASRKEKLATFAILLAAIGTVWLIDTLRPEKAALEAGYKVWLTLGGAFLLWGRSIAVPKIVNNAVVILARAMLFVYVFHWPISLFIGRALKSLTLSLFVGTIVTIVLWIAWESFWKALRVEGRGKGAEKASREYVPVAAGSEAA